MFAKQLFHVLLTKRSFPCHFFPQNNFAPKIGFSILLFELVRLILCHKGIESMSRVKRGDGSTEWQCQLLAIPSPSSPSFSSRVPVHRSPRLLQQVVGPTPTPGGIWHQEGGGWHHGEYILYVETKWGLATQTAISNASTLRAYKPKSQGLFHKEIPL